jgi:hypothetical protein
MSTIFAQQSLTITSQPGLGSQVAVPGQTLTLTRDQTRQLANAVAFTLATASNTGPNSVVATTILSYYSCSVIVASPSNYLEPRVTVAVTLPDTTLFATLLTVENARLMANAVALYSVS